MINVVYDACVLFSGSLRDLLMNIAVGKIAEAHWTDDIHEEWIHSLLKKRPGLKRETLERTKRSMDESLQGGRVTGYRYLIPELQLPDPNDRHVLAAAIYCGASLIVTNNLKDFPDTVLLTYKIKAVTPDEYVFQLIEENAEGVLDVVSRHRKSLTRPAKTPDEYLATLENQRLPKTVAFLREHQDRI